LAVLQQNRSLRFASLRSAPVGMTGFVGICDRPEPKQSRSLLAFRLSKDDGAEIAGRPVAAAARSRRH
jgi:hypothetical protein